MSTLPEAEFYSVLEMLSAKYPTEQTTMEVRRTPAGVYRYCTTLNGNDKLGLPFECGWGDSPREAAQDLIKDAGDRDPAVAIARAIRDHEVEIAKLRVTLANLALPPWKPIGQLGASNTPAAEPDPPPAFVNIESTTEEVKP